MAEKIELEAIIEIVKEIETEDPIDWGMLAVDEDDAVRLIANNILDQYNTEWQHLPEEQKKLIMLATITKLVVENFALNLKLSQRI